MSLLLENIAKHITLTAEEEELLLSKTEIRAYKAKTVLLKENDICKESFFVLNGIVRSYTIDENGVEHLVTFACPNWWIADMYSYISQQRGHLFIEALEDSEVLVLSKENQELLYHRIPKLERYFRILIENSLVANQQRLIDNMSFTAEARYDKFCVKYPELIHNIPQKQIASYIGVTPEFFSKMKSKLLRNQ